MGTSLKSRLEQLESEVKDLHPLLDTLFRKMPSIESTDYTHGPNEKGADFILTKLSVEFGDTEYIGVIVKRGKIKQNFSDISIQIEECSLRRFNHNGKKNIILSEIWVVANGTISNNAKEKIFDKYRSSKIKFVDLNLLTTWTTKYLPDFGIGVAIQETNFLTEQLSLCIQREQKFSILPSNSENAEVPLEIRQVDDDFDIGKENANIFNVVESTQFVSIEAQMGGGKSKLLNNIVKHYADLEVYKDKKIVPIYTSGKAILESGLSFSEYIEVEVEAAGLQEDPDRRYLVLVDSLDESRPNGDKTSEAIVELIEGLAPHPNISVVIASRDISDETIEANDTFRKHRYRIQPLSLKGMMRFIEQLCSGIDVEKRLIEDLKNSDLFKVLPKTPIAAIILAKLLAEGSEELPVNLTELYSKYCELSLGRWDIDKGLATAKQYEAIDAIVSNIASYIMENSLPGVSKTEAEDIFYSYLIDRNLQLDSHELLGQVLERSDILVEDTSNHTIHFKHRSFAEYYYARSLLRVQQVKITDHVFHHYWSNSFFFYIGLRRDCPELLEELLDIPIEGEGPRISKIINMGNFLLAGYQSPYDVIERGVRDIFTDAGQYYASVVHGTEESVLTKLPPMHLLALFHGILSSSYEYQFFDKAILGTIEEYATNPEMLEGTPYALFFLDSIRHSLGSDSLFENLVELYGNNLPLPLQLAIGAESDRISYKSPVIKKLKKRITRGRRSSQSFNDTVKGLYTDSIDSSVKLNTSGSRQKKK